MNINFCIRLITVRSRFTSNEISISMIFSRAFGPQGRHICTARKGTQGLDLRSLRSRDVVSVILEDSTLFRVNWKLSSGYLSLRRMDPVHRR